MLGSNFRQTEMNIQLIQLVTPILILFLGGFGWLYKHEKQKRVEVEKQLSDKKYNVYNNLTTVFFEILKQVKKGQKTNAEKLGDRMLDIKKDILIFGSDKVVRKYFYWEKNSSSNRALKSFAELIIEIRKDMGNPQTTITPTDFLKSILINENDFEELKKQGFILD